MASFSLVKVQSHVHCLLRSSFTARSAADQRGLGDGRTAKQSFAVAWFVNCAGDHCFFAGACGKGVS
jgi:hypothetical protein